MTEPSNLPRLYDEKEVAALLRRATELGKDDPARSARRGGMSLTELEDIAREAGIDPALVRRAAVEFDTEGAELEGWDRLYGDRSIIVHEAVVPGEVPVEAFEGLVGLIGATVDEQGHPSVLGRTLTWRGETPSRTRVLQVTVSARDGRTVIRAEERLRQYAVSLFAGGVAGFGGGLGFGIGLPIGIEVLGSVVAAVGLPAVAVGMGFLAARAIYGNAVRRRRAALSGLVTTLADAVQDAIGRRALGDAEPPLELPRG